MTGGAMEDGILTQEEKRIAELVQETLGDRINEPFEPFAHYNPNLDWLSVVTKDCDYFESRWGVLVIYRENHPNEGESKCVGFTIPFAKRYCERRPALIVEGKVRISKVLDAIELDIPALRRQINIARNLVSKLKSDEVNMTP